MTLLCRILGHRIDIRSVSITGHDSSRTGRCTRCKVLAWQPRRYYGGAAGPWRVGGPSGRRLRVWRSGCL